MYIFVVQSGAKLIFLSPHGVKSRISYIEIVEKLLFLIKNNKINKQMKELLKSFYYSRFGQYTLFTISYVLWYILLGFEKAVIIALASIIAEISYQDIKRN